MKSKFGLLVEHSCCRCCCRRRRRCCYKYVNLSFISISKITLSDVVVDNNYVGVIVVIIAVVDFAVCLV